MRERDSPRERERVREGERGREREREMSYIAVAFRESLVLSRNCHC